MTDVLGRKGPFGRERVVAALPLKDQTELEAYAGGATDVLGRAGVSIHRVVAGEPTIDTRPL